MPKPHLAPRLRRLREPLPLCVLAAEGITFALLLALPLQSSSAERLGGIPAGNASLLLEMGLIGVVSALIMLRSRLARRRQSVAYAAAGPMEPPAAATLRAGEDVLGRRALKAFSEIDRAILSRAGPDRLVELVLRHLPAFFRCESLCVTVLDPGLVVREGALDCNDDQCGMRSVDRRPVSPAIARHLASKPDGAWTNHLAGDAFLVPLAQHGASGALLLPVFIDANLAAILSIGLAGGDRPGAQQQVVARDFADRLGVALTAVARTEELYTHAYLDRTTSLPNRRYLDEQLVREIARTRREQNRLALLFINLDGFKKVNESAGYAGGDLVLEEVSQRLRNRLRGGDLVARFNGDEFVVVLSKIAASRDATVVAEQLLAELGKPYPSAGQEHHLGASIGISVFPDDAQTGEQLVRNGDLAMSAAKAAGRGRYSFYDASIHSEVLARSALERDLRSALRNRELVLFYQPQIDMQSGRVVGAEALVRWNHPQRGMIPPADFIGFAEQSSLIEELGEYVMRMACTQYRAWECAGVAPPRVSVNVTSREIRRPGFVEKVETVLRETGLRPYCLELEITEGLLMETSKGTAETLQRLNDRGFRVAIDDFGTGYSSLAYLKRLPFDVLKIDRLFVKDIGTGDRSEAIVVAIAGVAHGLGKQMVAEGVETEQQRAFLAQLGCAVGQGYLWSRPVPAAEFEKFCREAAIAQPVPGRSAAARPGATRSS